MSDAATPGPEEGDASRLARIEARLARLEADLTAAQDRLDIYQLTAAYGPAVDSGDSRSAAELWVPEGVYDWGQGLAPDSPTAALGRKGIAAMVEGPEHQSVINRGAAHWLGLPYIDLQGDRAVSIGYSCLFVRTAEGYAAARVSACHFEWARSNEGWRAVRRCNRLLDGSAEARLLLAAGIAGAPAPEAC